MNRNWVILTNYDDDIVSVCSDMHVYRILIVIVDVFNQALQ